MIAIRVNCPQRQPVKPNPGTIATVTTTASPAHHEPDQEQPPVATPAAVTTLARAGQPGWCRSVRSRPRAGPPGSPRWVASVDDGGRRRRRPRCRRRPPTPAGTASGLGARPTGWSPETASAWWAAPARAPAPVPAPVRSVPARVSGSGSGPDRAAGTGAGCLAVPAFWPRHAGASTGRLSVSSGPGAPSRGPVGSSASVSGHGHHVGSGRLASPGSCGCPSGASSCMGFLPHRAALLCHTPCDRLV